MVEESIATPAGDKEITSDDKLWALLMWLFWPLGIVVLLMEDKKDRPFLKYNAVLSLAFAVVVLVTGTITLGCLAIVGAVYAIVLGIKAYKGEWVEVPMLSDFVRNQGWV